MEVDTVNVGSETVYYRNVMIQDFVFPGVPVTDMTRYGTIINFDTTPIATLNPIFTVQSFTALTTPTNHALVLFRIDIDAAITTINPLGETINVNFPTTLITSDNTGTNEHYASLRTGIRALTIPPFVAPPPGSVSTGSGSGDAYNGYISQKPRNERVDLVNATPSKTLMVASASTALIIGIAGAFSVGCMNFSAAFIKLF
jgi:hypothetical protein